MWCETWLDVWNQSKLKAVHWLGLIQHITVPHNNLIEAVNLNFNKLPVLLRILYYNVFFVQIGYMFSVLLSLYIFISYFS